MNQINEKSKNEPVYQICRFSISKFFLNAIKVFIFLIVVLANNIHSQNTNNNLCDSDFSKLYESFQNSLEREYFVTSLQTCKTTSKLTRLIESIITKDDVWVREAAWKVLNTHKDLKTISFLIKINQSEELSKKELQLLYKYLNSLGKPESKNELEEIFIRGIFHSNEKIRHYSLIGLGKIRSTITKEYFAQILKKSNSNKKSILVILEAIKYLKSNRSFEFVKMQLYNKNAEIQKKAIEVQISLNTQLALQELLVLNNKGPHPQNQSLLHNFLSNQKTKKSYKKTLYINNTARVFELASNRSRLIAVLDKDTIVYIEEKTKLNYRIYSKGSATTPQMDPYIKIHTNKGIQGWIFRAKTKHKLTSIN